jgi:signal transduction histidine kinase
MKDLNPAQSRRLASRRLLAGVVVAAFVLRAAAQNSFPSRAAPAPLPQPVISNQLDVLAPASRVITNLDEVLGLSLGQAQRRQPVKALATVTYCHPQWGMLFVQSAGLGTFLDISHDTPPMRPGDVVEIEGSTTSAHGYPELKVKSLTPTGQWQTLTPRTWSLDDILSGRASGQWLQIEGWVLAAYERDGRLLIQTAVGTTNIKAYLLNWHPEEARQLLEARVRITGVLSVQFDDKGRRADVLVLAEEPEQVQVLQVPAINPLDLPVIPIGRLTVSKEDKAPQRVHVQGALEQRPDGTAAAVRDNSGQVQIQCLYKPGFRPDAGVDAFGYACLADGELILKDAMVLPTGSMITAEKQNSQQSSTNQPSLPLLVAAQSIRRLSKSEAARGYPVQLEAVVTYSDSHLGYLFVQDASGGIFVKPAGKAMAVRPGQRIRVHGTTEAGDLAPIVRRATFEVLGEAPMPAPARVGLNALLTGQFDCRWVEIHGVVQSATEQGHACQLQLMTAQGQIPALLGPSMSMAEAEQLVDARLCLRGVVGGQFNQQGQIVSVRLHVPNASAVSVDEPAPAKPFSIPTQQIADLYSYQPDQDIFRRVKISGRVTSVTPDQTISLQDESGGMLLRLTRWDRLPCLREQVEVIGYPAAGDFSITLKDAWSRIAGPGGNTTARIMTADEVLTNEPNAELVQIEARLIQDTWLRPAQVLVLQSGSVVFEAMLPRNFNAESEEYIAANTRLQVTGVCLLEGGRWGQVKTFHLRVRAPGDLKILIRPSWWNLRRLVLTLSVTGLLGTMGLVWSLLLAKKNRLLSEQIHERERAEEELQRAHAALQHANDSLEQRVAARTLELREQIAARDKAHAELAAAQKDLMEASREAGMAELATGVLHNVGNVLNSLNVSTTIIREKLRRSEFLTLGKVRGLLKEHEADLTAFLTTDPKGKLVPGFIIKLADNIDKELSLLQAEHEQLTRNVEHIKEIVAMQQRYARVSGSREELSIAGLVDDALQINSAGFTRDGIKIVRDYSDVPPVTVDKHKVLQILVNLITNAKHALDESGRPDRRLTLKTGMNGNSRLNVSVSDNGVGIAPENLTRLFTHGFTTRKTGHGFGLYSGATAAKEMGGQLTAYSEGAGKGATFVLEIPIEDQKNN